MPPILASTRAQEALSTARLDWRVSSELVALARMSLLFQVRFYIREYMLINFEC